MKLLLISVTFTLLVGVTVVLCQHNGMYTQLYNLVGSYVETFHQAEGQQQPTCLKCCVGEPCIEVCEWTEWCNWASWETCTSTCNAGCKNRCRRRCRCCYSTDPECNACPGGDPESDESYDYDYSVCDEHEYCKTGECNKCEGYDCLICHNDTGTMDAYHLAAGECTPKCNWLGHFCYPGVCDNDDNYLYTSCECIEGFEQIRPDKYTTKCTLTHTPDIATCRLGAESPLGEAANTTFKDNSTSCDSTIDAFVNFEIDHMYFEYSFSFDYPVLPPSDSDRHSYIAAYAHGVVDASDTIIYYDKDGNTQTIGTVDSGNHQPSMCSVGDFGRDNPLSGMLITCELNQNYGDLSHLKDGEKVCHNFEVEASGYLDIQDMANLHLDPERHYDSSITRASRDICFHTDYTKPDHCVHLDPACNSHVLDFGNRIRRDLDITVTFDGWFDPEPDSVVSQASGIKEYEIEIRDVMYTPTELFADFKSLAIYVSHGEDVHVPLPERNVPTMYAVYIWALDNTQEGPNYEIARRFVLTDNTSTVQTHRDYPMVVTSASADTGLEWQTMISPIKLNWENHFYNDWHIHTNLLLPIRSDGNYSISGAFEQETGELPVSGTPNIDGIVHFMYKYRRISAEGETNSNFFNVTHSETEALTITEFQPIDGDWIDITIKAIDIMNNTLDDMVTVKIDSSPPLIEDMCLVKDGYKQLFVHNSTDLSQMNMTFNSYDPHSGMKTVFWKLGTEPGKSDIGIGALPVVRVGVNDSCSSHCHCPQIGQCQYYTYVIPLDGLIANNTHTGDHNREYHFTFEVMNEAHLETIDQVVILIDSTPPEVGHVFDGPPGSKDRDFQSIPTLTWHWNGFIDHESGISKYHIAVGERCFTTEEIQFLHAKDITNLTDMYYFSVRLAQFVNYMASEPGFYRLTVIAFNGAMQPSMPVYSSGIVYDITPPRLHNISVVGGIHQKSILCSQNDMWYVDSPGILQQLSPVEVCRDRCNNATLYSSERFRKYNVQNGTLSPQYSEEKSKELCTLFSLYTEETPLFLRSNNIHLTWAVYENESQIQDYFIGLASNIHGLERPDILKFQSTHNKTDFKCIHCGIGQGETFYISHKVINKASLYEIVPIGPVVFDNTPPQYNGGIEVTFTEGNVVVSWNTDSFIDEDYDDILHEYEWSLGTSNQGQEVVPWQVKIFPFNYTENEDKFKMTYPKENLQLYDQDRGLEYQFSVKAFNRGLLYSTVISEHFQIHSKVLPASGIVTHVHTEGILTKEIGFQENNKELCIKWYGFNHPSQQMNISIGLGTLPYHDNVIKSFQTNRTKSICIKDLDLPSGYMYYAVVTCSNAQGYSNATSKGIYIATEDDILDNAITTVGDNCPDTFQYILDDYPISWPDPETIKLNFTSTIPTTSQPYMTVKFKLTGNDIGQKENIKVFYEEKQLLLESWKIFDNEIWLFYSFVQMTQTVTILTETINNITITNAHVDLCSTTSQQVATQAVTVEWYLIHPHVIYTTNYELRLVQNSTNNSVLMAMNTGKHSRAVITTQLQHSIPYTACIRPCFQMTCLERTVCKDFVIDLSGPIPGDVSSYIDSQDQTKLADGHIYKFGANWDLFSQQSVQELDKMHVYDWTIALDQYGSSTLLPWRRVMVNETKADKVSEDIYIHVYKFRTLYFMLRCVSPFWSTTISSSMVELRDLWPRSGVQVFDLPSTYNIDALRDYLHSGNLGKESSELHNADVDFTRDKDSVSAAVLGCDCGEYVWSIQTNADLICNGKDTHHIGCVAKKETTDNVVKFTRLHLKYVTNYTICVTSGGKCTEFFACSNGFVIDNKPPLPGKVLLAMDGNSHTYDSTAAFISWNGFTDIEQILPIPFTHGIKNYQVALGSAPGEVDIQPFQNVSISDHTYLKGLKMTSGRQYYATVKACDHVDLCTSVSSNAFTVDTTPPIIKDVEFTHSYLFNDLSDLLIRCESIEDPESGISIVEYAIGTTPYGQEVYPYTKVDSKYITLTAKGLVDGQLYYSHVKATNEVGLWALQPSAPILYDSSPPETGYIRHGIPGEESYSYTTIDDHMKFHWGGFADSHTGIFYYRVAVGTEAYMTDVMHWKDMGTKTELKQDVYLIHGQPYYITVEACNGVLLCSSAGSSALIVDDSAPITGVVHIGNSEEHETYQYNRHSISIKWFGFQDPQSGINRYVWCINSLNGTCDIYPLTEAHKATHIMPTNLHLPLHTELYVTIIAYNNVQMYTYSHSKIFLVDVTAPVVHSKPVVTTYSSLKAGTQFDRSYISLQWKMSDDETPMVSHSVSITSHHDGVTPVPDYILGNVDTITIPLTIDQQLRDGSIYTVKVTGCNAASLCTSNTTEDLLLDSSPPLLGGFVEPMYWRKQDGNTILSLSWQGFTDPHSYISKYYLLISSDYNGGDLSNGILRVDHQPLEIIQENEIVLYGKDLPIDKLIYLSIWSENGVGLLTDAAKVSVFVLPQEKSNGKQHKHGVLDIQKHSCDLHYCNNDCTCAIVGGYCVPDGVRHQCIERNNTNTNKLKVHDGLYTNERIITPSSVCLPGYWISNFTSTDITRYEWSVSMAGQEPGFGVIDVSSEKYLFDVELYDRAVYCLERNTTLLQGESYWYHVNAWHSFDEYSHFTSVGVLIDTTPPKIGMGRHILDMDSNMEYEVDFTIDTSGVYASWDGVFSDAESGILHYIVSIGTSQGGSELLGPLNMALSTNISFTEVELIPGFKYYTSVVAYNTVGMAEIAYSSGFIIDIEAPYEGVVFTDCNFKDKPFKSGNHFMVSWNGFSDRHSYIQDYYFSIDKEGTPVSNLEFILEMLQNEVLIESELEHNEKYQVFVKAKDAAGHESHVVTSSSFLIDKTEPTLLQCRKNKDVIYSSSMDIKCEEITEDHDLRHCKGTFDTNIAVRNGHMYKLQLFTDIDLSKIKAKFEFGDHTDWVLFERHSWDKYVHEGSFIANDNAIISPVFYTSQYLDTDIILNISKCEAVVFDTLKCDSCNLNIKQWGQHAIKVIVPTFDAESGIADVQVGLGTDEGGFQLNPLKSIGKAMSVVVPVYLQHKMYAFTTVIVTNNAGTQINQTFSPLLIDWTPPIIENLRVDVTYEGNNITIDASWKTFEEESDVTDCLWALGSIPTLSNILDWEETNTKTTAQISGLSLSHGDIVHTRVKCYNYLNLYTEAVSDGNIIGHDSPDSDGAYMVVVPQKETFYDPRNLTQVDDSVIGFSFNGFYDPTGVSYLEYKISDTGVWINASKQDYIFMEDNSLYNGQENKVYVRAVNNHGITSDSVEGIILINTATPRLTGYGLQWDLNGNTITIKWTDIFQWDSEHGYLHYEVYIGTEEGASDLHQAFETKHQEHSVTSTKLTPPATCYCVITAIAPSGEYQTYTEAINI